MPVPTYQIPPDTRGAGTPDPAADMNAAADMLGLLTSLFAQLAGAGTSPDPGGNAVNAAAAAALRTAAALAPAAAGTVLMSNGTSSAPTFQPPPGLQFLTGGGTLSTAKITAAQAAGFQGIFLDPRFAWDASGLVINGVQNFIIESRMTGSIGWSGHISYNTGGYITTSTGSPADGIQVYASVPGGPQTQGIIFRNCVIVGANSSAVVHFGGGQRRCGLVDCLVYNTASTAGAYGVITDTALSNNNSEDMIFSFTGGGGIAGAYAAVGIGIADQTQHANDTLWTDLPTAGGTYSVVANNGGNHNFINYYDRSAPTTATVWNHGGALYFRGGEDLNSGTGVAHLLDVSGATTVIENRTLTRGGGTADVTISNGQFVCKGKTRGSGIISSSGGTTDLSDPATSTFTVSGTGGNLFLAGSYLGTAPTDSRSGGTTNFQAPMVVASARASAQTTTQTVTWTPPALNCRIRVSVMIHPTVAGTSTVPTVAFTEYGGQARSYAMAMWQQNGAAAAPSYTCAATDTFCGSFESDTDASATAVTVTVTPTGSTFRYSAVIERLT